MPGLVQISENTALFYFEIELPKTLHMEMREELKTKALQRIEYLVTPCIRNCWSEGNDYPGSHDPQAIRDFADARCEEADNELTVRTTGIDSDFYCWTEANRICYHAFTVWHNNVKQSVRITNCGMEFATDLLLVMAYPTVVSTPVSTTKPKSTTKTKKRPSKSSRRKSTRKR